MSTAFWGGSAKLLGVERSMIKYVMPLLALCLLGAPVAAQQAPPAEQQNVERKPSGDWTVECVKNQQDQRLCQMVQNIPDPKSGKTLMQVVVAKPADAKSPLLTVIAPLGVWLRPGLEFSVDGGQANALAFEFCLKEGCLAQLELTSGLASALKRGTSINIGLQNIRRQKLELKVSLKGFTAGFDML